MYNIGDAVKKVGGDYEFVGRVVAGFRNLSGLRRYVVEDDRGVLHVYSDKVLAPASEDELNRSMIDDIKDFHEKFGLAYRGLPQELSAEASAFRIKFMQEELNEYIDAVNKHDLVQQLDALVDLVYVALGTAYLQGLPFEDGWNEVQRANMRKVRAAADGSNSKRGSPLDVVKPEGWVGPDMADVLHRAYCQNG